MGIVSGMLLAGLISASQYGWHWVFYLYGLLSGTWCIFYVFLGFDSPAVHPSINQAERAYIETSLGKMDRKSVSCFAEEIDAIFSKIFCRISMFLGRKFLSLCQFGLF